MDTDTLIRVANTLAIGLAFAAVVIISLYARRLSQQYRSTRRELSKLRTELTSLQSAHAAAGAAGATLPDQRRTNPLTEQNPHAEDSDYYQPPARHSLRQPIEDESDAQAPRKRVVGGRR